MLNVKKTKDGKIRSVSLTPTHNLCPTCAEKQRRYENALMKQMPTLKQMKAGGTPKNDDYNTDKLRDLFNVADKDIVKGNPDNVQKGKGTLGGGYAGDKSKDDVWFQIMSTDTFYEIMRTHGVTYVRTDGEKHVP